MLKGLSRLNVVDVWHRNSHRRSIHIAMCATRKFMTAERSFF